METLLWIVAVGFAVSGVEGAPAFAASRLWPWATGDGAVAAAGPVTALTGSACWAGACAAAGVRPAAARASAHANSFIFTPVTWVWGLEPKTEPR